MIAFTASFMLVLLAEMGDKTQLLAMAFAMKYGAAKVLLAVFFATLLVNAIAVGAGHILAAVIPFDIISFIASLSFIVFGIWTVREEESGREEKKGPRFGPILTVGIAFFLAEMGDKTQLAAISLAVQYRDILGVLMGTTLAMVSADAVGIAFGMILHKRISEKKIKWLAACAFILFGLSGIYRILSARVEAVLYVWLIILLISAAAFYGMFRFSRPKRILKERT